MRDFYGHHGSLGKENPDAKEKSRLKLSDPLSLLGERFALRDGFQICITDRKSFFNFVTFSL